MPEDTTSSEPNVPAHPNNEAVGHLYAAKAELSNMAHKAGRTPVGRCYNILVTDLEKLIHLEAGYFPRYSDGDPMKSAKAAPP